MRLLPLVVALQLVAAGEALAAPEQAASGNNCLWVRDISYTSVVDAKTVLFHMRDHSVWKNTLLAPCRALRFHGFVYRTNAERICSAGEPITVLVTNEVCTLGRFDPVKPQ